MQMPPTPQSFCLSRSGWGLRTCIPGEPLGCWCWLGVQLRWPKASEMVGEKKKNLGPEISPQGQRVNIKALYTP